MGLQNQVLLNSGGDVASSNRKFYAMPSGILQFATPRELLMDTPLIWASGIRESHVGHVS